MSDSPSPESAPSGSPATVAVMTQHRLDEAALDRLLRDALDGYGGRLELTQFPGGYSNPTYKLRAWMRDGTPRDLVLRKKPAGKLLQSAHQVDREYRVIRALADSGVPVPRTVLFQPDGNPALEQAFFLMDYVPGRVFGDPSLPGLPKADRAAVFDSMGEVMARLHALDHRALGLAEFERPEPFIPRQIERWTKQYRAAQTHEIADMEHLAKWLPANMPKDASVTISHGDYRLGNVIVHPVEPRVVAVLDWELWTIGHPLCDLAFTCMAYHLPELPAGMAGKDWRALGIPTEAEYVAAYCRRTGRERIEDWNFYLVFNLFKLAAIVQGVYKRALDGTAASSQALERGRNVAERAAIAMRLIG